MDGMHAYLVPDQTNSYGARVPASFLVVKPCAPVGQSLQLRTIHDDTYFTMELLRFSTPKRISGILHAEIPKIGEVGFDLLFLGYHCSECDQIFLVPDAVTNESDLHVTMQHRCNFFYDPELDLWDAGAKLAGEQVVDYWKNMKNLGLGVSPSFFEKSGEGTQASYEKVEDGV
jgi:hypothetical protein